MEKTGWQIAAGVLGIACAGLAVGVAANRNALAETQRQLAEVKASKQPEQETLTIVKREPCPDVSMPQPEPNTECRGGVLLRRTDSGWVSVTHNGYAVRCNGG